jgi:hypothetical protein
MTANPRKFAIPTLYNGVKFRSRLEARYAAFFDELDWRWKYEALELDSYLPDFLILFEKRPLLFEVKGFDEELRAAQLKIEMSGWDGDSLIACGDVDGQTIGHVNIAHPELRTWEEADVFFCINCGRVAVAAGGGSWRCRHCGAREGHVGSYDPEEAWNKAGNRVQWSPGT